ncbi:helix-turn-helix domain-containing protein [Zhouia sp. PK063]|uniref:helix-turn-helix domain-containing protein n=1 Tax=Zhouia sp. PK063 TaxID=3373602 RepID=UPI0037BB8505
MKTVSIEDFYKEIKEKVPENISKELGHFNVFNLEDLYDEKSGKHIMPYNRRAYFKISLIKGSYRADYADKVIKIKENALLFATPKIPYNWTAINNKPIGQFCVFTSEFINTQNSRINTDEFPLFTPGEIPVFEITNAQAKEIEVLFNKIHTEFNSDYEYKYDLIRNYVVELIHEGQKIRAQQKTEIYKQNGTSKIFNLFIELLERQFPIESPQQKLSLRSAKDYADRLAIHTNYLNKIVKEHSGYSTTKVINERILQEAKILLKHSDWNVSEIAQSLNFEEIAHFSNFFKKRTSFSPNSFR